MKTKTNQIPKGIFTKARLIARGMSESDIHDAIKSKLITVRPDGTMMSKPPKIAEATRTVRFSMFKNRVKPAPITEAVKHTTCRHCGLDIEGHSPYRSGEWRDRGNNTTCNDGKHKHQPLRAADLYPDAGHNVRRLADSTEIPSGSTVQRIKDGKPVRLQVVKKNGSKYSVIDPETKQVDEVDEKDLAIVDDKDKVNESNAQERERKEALRNAEYELTSNETNLRWLLGEPWSRQNDAKITRCKAQIAASKEKISRLSESKEPQGPYSAAFRKLKAVVTPDRLPALRQMVDRLNKGEDERAVLDSYHFGSAHGEVESAIIGESSGKYIVWVDDGDGWEEQGDGPLTLKQAERIASEVRRECRCKAKYLPVGQRPLRESLIDALLEARAPSDEQHRSSRNSVNRDLDKLTHNRYFPSVPTKEIAEILEKHGMPSDAVDGIYTGREGRSREQIGDTGHYLVITWYKMESGNYEIVAYVS